MSIWLEVSVATTAAGLPALAELLTARGVVGLVLEEEGDFQRFLAENRQYWDYVDDALLEKMKGVARILFYVPDDDAGRAQLETFVGGAKPLPYELTKLREEDWNTSWQKYYKPMTAGEKIYIVPEWERGSAAIPAGRTALYLSPGLTFGTGSHASTRMCLAGLEGCITAGGRVLDLGCGSGILSIAALLLGFQTAVGVDIDEKSVTVAAENASFNGIGSSRFTVRSGDVLGDAHLVDTLAQSPWNLVLANIVSDVIIPLSGMVHRLLAPSGTFLCSGIIDTRRGEVAAALVASGLTITRTWEQDGWCAFAAKL